MPSVRSFRAWSIVTSPFGPDTRHSVSLQRSLNRLHGVLPPDKYAGATMSRSASSVSIGGLPLRTGEAALRALDALLQSGPAALVL